MAIFKDRLASLQDITLVFASCVVAIYSWSILIFFYRLPAWLLHLTVWDILNIAAYTFTLNLLESLVILCCLIILAAILPADLLRNKFGTRGGTLVLITAILLAIFQYSTDWYLILPGEVWLWSEVVLVALLISYLLYRYQQIEERLYFFLERLTIFLYIYVPLSLIGVAIVVFRNI